MHKGSSHHRLSQLEIGQIAYVGTTLERYPNDMRVLNAPKSRRPAELKDRKFTASLFTAVGAGCAGDIRYLIAIERIS